MAKGIKTGGRKKGTPNKTTSEKIQAIAKAGIMPLDYMLQVLRDPKAKRADRLDAAKSAAPYVHSKMPTALVQPPHPSPEPGADDETVLDLYLLGLHAEADED